MKPNDDAQSEEDIDDDGDGDESDDIHGDDPIRGLDMLLWRHLCLFNYLNALILNTYHGCQTLELTHRLLRVYTSLLRVHLLKNEFTSESTRGTEMNS